MFSIDLSGQTAVVTGASSGLGAEMARTLARAGAAVAVNYSRNREGAEAVAAEITGAGGKALVLQADVTEEADVERMFREARAGLGPVTLLVNNAGREEALGHPFELEWADYQRMLDLNIRAIYLTSRQAHPDMKAAGRGRIINIGSVAFHRPFPGSAAYVTAKGAMMGLTRSLAYELGPDNITVNLVAPGWVPVPRHASAPAEALEKLVAETPLGRYGVPAEVAGAVLFLASDLASFVSGTQLPVNGGHSFFG